MPKKTEMKFPPPKHPCRHGRREWDGADPDCAFDEKGRFLKTNWNCRLMSMVRALGNSSSYDGSDKGHPRAPGTRVWHDDQNLSVVPFFGGSFMVLSFYKDRGNVEGFWVVDGKDIRRGTETDARAAVKLHAAFLAAVWH